METALIFILTLNRYFLSSEFLLDLSLRFLRDFDFRNKTQNSAAESLMKVCQTHAIISVSIPYLHVWTCLESRLQSEQVKGTH